jgi:nitrite reductase/ring-hydroxylating ferredoxin subunit
VASLAAVRAAGCLPVQAEGHNLALFAHGERVWAVDNRCPHMGFPLSQGTVKEGILTCHWHHARFDLATGGAFDQFADDVRAFPVEVRGDEVWVELTPRAPEQARAHQRARLQDGLERDLPLVIAKAVLTLSDSSAPMEMAVEPLRIGLDFGTRFREGGWGQGLTILTCLANLMPHLAPEDRPRALYHGLSAVARDSIGQPPRFMVRPLPGGAPDAATLQRWFRQFVEVRDAEGAERAVISAVQASARDPEAEVPMAARREIAGMLFAAATDHRYLQIGHVLDFTNKALEALDLVGWTSARAAQVLSSLAQAYANADRMEESNAWRNPVDLVEILEGAFDELPGALIQGEAQRAAWAGPARTTLTPIVLADDPAATVAALLDALRAGCSPEELAEAVAYAAALRIARFHTSNEFGDWDTALHTFTFANAVHQGLRRAPAAELTRGVFDAAMSVYLDRFLNVPAAALPAANGSRGEQAALLAGLLPLLDRQQQVEGAAEAVAAYLDAGGNTGHLTAMLGKLLLREDRNFHTIQTLEAAVRQSGLLASGPAPAPVEASHVLVAAARYLAAHAPTMRAQGQTYQIAVRLSRGERLFEG